MSPIVVLVFAPVVLGGIALFAVFFGAAAAGTLDTVERHTQAAGIHGSPSVRANVG